MAVNPLQIPGYQQGPDANFAPLASLGKIYQNARQEQSLADLGKGLAEGTLDYQKAASQAFAVGNTDAGMKFLALAEVRRKEALGQDAARSFLGGGNAGAGGGVITPSSPMPKLGSREYSETEFNPLDAAVATPTELAAGVPAPPQYAALVGKAATDYDIPPALLAAQIKQESGFNPNAVSPAGASGISQFMPDTAREMGLANPRDPQQAIPAGARYLRENIDRFGGSVPLGLAAYNAGPTRVQQSGGDFSRLPAETQNYVKAITGAAPQQVAQAAPQQGGGVLESLSPDARRAAAALMNPNLPDGTKKFAETILTNELKKMDEPERVKVLRAFQKDPSLFAAAKDLAQAGSTKVEVGKGETEEEKAAGKAAGERRGAMFTAAAAAPKTMGNLARMDVLLDQVNTGKLAPAQMTVSGWAKALGVNDDFAKKIGLDPKALGSAQALSALAGEMVIGKIGSGQFPSNNFSDNDREFLLGTVPQLTTDPRANKIMTRTARRMAELDMEKARDYATWKKDPDNKGFENFELQWSEKHAGKDRFADIAAEAKALIGPKGGAAATPQPAAQPRATPQAAPPQGDFEEPRQASDGNFYIRRGGKTFKVVQ